MTPAPLLTPVMRGSLCLFKVIQSWKSAENRWFARKGQLAVEVWRPYAEKMSSVQIAYKLIFQKKENPQTAILSHLWDCVMVTRTGIELIPSILVVFSKTRKWLYFADFWSFIYSNFKRFQTIFSTNKCQTSAKSGAFPPSFNALFNTIEYTITRKKRSISIIRMLRFYNLIRYYYL